ncbi:MAG: CarD family transcriptional regulator, partial [Cellulomonadaceae bacterium]
MTLTGILPILLEDPAVAAAVEGVVARGERDIVGPAGVRPPLLALLSGARPAGAEASAAPRARSLVVVTATGREADQLADTLRCYLPYDDVAVLPAWETLPHERLSPRSDTVARRLAVFRRLAHPDGRSVHSGPIRVLVMPVRAMLQPVVAGLGDLEPVSLQTGDTADLSDVVDRLAGAAYTRVDMVERRGEFAVRGGILDVFAPTDDHPQRVEFWGETVEEIRWFAVADQRSLEVSTDGLWAPPCRELLLTDAVRERAAALITRLPGATEMLERMADGIAVEGMESLAPALVDAMVPVLDLVPDDALLVIDEPERVRRRAHDLVATTEEFLAAAWTSAAAGAATPIDLSAASFATIADCRDTAARRGLGWWTLTAFGLDGEVAEAGPAANAGEHGESLRIDAREVRTYRGDVAKALEDLRRHERDGWRLVLTTEGHGPAQRMAEQLGAAETAARLVPSLDVEPPAGVVSVTTAAVGPGFASESLRLAVFSESDITGRAGATTRDMRKMPSRRRNVVDPLQLRAGDYVVHEQHGVGRFVELVQ